MATGKMVVTATAESALPVQGGLRPVDPVRDLGTIANLMSEAFALDLDERGQAVLREMRWMARLSPVLWWWAQADPAFRDSFAGFVWEEPSPGGRGMQVVGNVSLNQAPGDRRRRIICNVVVQAEYRGQGIARRLTEAAIDEARRLGAEGVVLQVYQDNPPALNLYTSLGFREADGETSLRLPDPRPVSIVSAPGYQIRTWRPSDGQAVYELAWETTAPVQHWLAPIRKATYQPDWWARGQRWLTDTLAGRRSVCLTVRQGQRLVAAMTVTAAFRGGDHHLHLLVHPDHAGPVEPALVSRGVHMLAKSAPRPARTTVAKGQAATLELLRGYGFEEQRTLLTLRKDFA